MTNEHATKPVHNLFRRNFSQDLAVNSPPNDVRFFAPPILRLDNPAMKSIAITGGIGSGKSTVCEFLAELGAVIFHADDVAKDIMVTDDDVRAELTAAFGPSAYSAEGALNRAYLASIVFRDQASRKRINDIIHPRVYTAFEEARREADEAGAPMIVLESAVLFDSESPPPLNAIVVVTADPEERVGRVVARDKYNATDVRDRTRAQLSDDEFAQRATYVLENNGTLDELRMKTRALYGILTQSNGVEPK